MKGLVRVGLVVVLVSVGPSPGATEDPPECEDISAVSLKLLGERLGLTPDQLGWVDARFASGSLRRPEDFDGLPGAGDALRETLVAALCWNREGNLRSVMMGRRTPTGSQQEIRTQAVSGDLRVNSRARWKESPSPELRGGVSWSRGFWSVRAGHLRGRRALGLVVATPGAEPRGATPVTSSTSRWATTLSLDAETLRGVSLDRTTGPTHAGVAFLRGTILGADGKREPGWWGLGEWGRSVGSGRGGLVLLRSGASWAGGLSLGAVRGAGTWNTEWSWAEEGTAQGTAVAFALGQVRARASVLRIGPGYRIPGIRRYARSPSTESVTLALEGRWQRDRRQFLRVLVHGLRKPGDGTAIKTQDLREIEIGEPLGSHLRLGILWRSKGTGEGSSQESEQLLRTDLTYRRGGHTLTLRLQEGAGGLQGTRLVSIRVGGGKRVRWQTRADLFSGEGLGPWVYRRRAGSFFGWERLGPGTWIGGWIRIPAGGWELELSGDGRGDGWDLAAALQIPLGFP